MTEREKVIRGLEVCKTAPEFREECEGCPYNDGEVDCIARMAADALELLKAQEPIAPYMDYDGQDVWRCGNCGATLFHLSHTQADENEQNCVRYCRYCGKTVKWDG